MKKPNNFKSSTIAYAFLFATSPVWGGPTKGGPPPQNLDGESSPPPPPISTPSKKIGGKTSPRPPVTNRPKIRFTKVQVDQAEENKVEECKVPPKVRLRSPRPRHVTSLAFDSDKKRVVTLQFFMTRVPVTKDEQVLVLLSSRCLTRKPSIELKKSGYKLALDFKDLRQLEVFNIPTSKSATTSAGKSVTFDVPLNTKKLAEQVKAGNETFYFQAGLLKKADFDDQHYSDMILSPLEAVHFTSKACPDKKQYKKQIRSTNTSCKQLQSKSGK